MEPGIEIVERDEKKDDVAAPVVTVAPVVVAAAEVAMAQIVAADGDLAALESVKGVVKTSVTSVHQKRVSHPETQFGVR